MTISADGNISITPPTAAAKQNRTRNAAADAKITNSLGLTRLASLTFHGILICAVNARSGRGSDISLLDSGYEGDGSEENYRRQDRYSRPEKHRLVGARTPGEQ